MVQFISRTLTCRGFCISLVQWFLSKDTVEIYENSNQSWWPVAGISKSLAGTGVQMKGHRVEN